MLLPDVTRDGECNCQTSLPTVVGTDDIPILNENFSLVLLMSIEPYTRHIIHNIYCIVIGRDNETSLSSNFSLLVGSTKQWCK